MTSTTTATFPGKAGSLPGRTRALHFALSKLMDASAGRRQTDFMDDAEKQDTIENVTARIIARDPAAPRNLVARVVAEEHDQLASSRIRTYIPTLIERGARNRITGSRPPGT